MYTRKGLTRFLLRLIGPDEGISVGSEVIRRFSGDPVRMESIFFVSSIGSFSSGGCGGRQPPALFLLSKYALQ